MKRLAKLLDGGLRMLDQERLVRESGFFDAEWYARNYPQAGGPRAALAHFLQKGAARGFDPGPAFSTSAYLSANPDVREAGYNALVHYLRFGRAEGRGARDPSSGSSQPLGLAAMERIAEAFDPEFYLATNPDLDEGCSGIDHFLGQGWKARRDPCRWFSVEYYLAAHPDVADTGENPFVHYLLWGCREGRSIRPSRRPSFTGETDLIGHGRFAALAMVRNEGDIIRAFSGHLLALFDDVVFVDHMSDDGTGEFLKALAAENRRVRVFHLEEPAYIQSVTMTHMVRETDVLRDAGWVFLLDADEFLPFSSRQDFEAAMARHARCPVIEMRWQNLVPEIYWTGEVALTRGTRFIAPPELSPFRKIAFQPDRLSLARTVVAQGNHALVETQNGFEIPAFAADFPLLHVPVRSVDQLVLKLNQGVESYRQLGGSRDAAHGTHWDQMLRATSTSELNGDILNGVVVRYSEDKPELVPQPAARLLEGGHQIITVDIAHKDTGIKPLPERRLGELLMRIHGRPAALRETKDCPMTMRLEVKGHALCRAGDDPGAEYPSLPADDCDDSQQDRSHSAVLSRFLSQSYRDIEDLVPSPKAEHIPFFFSLTHAMRPRRYVEIGTLRGASFLAFCQATRQSNIAAQAVAISGWAVGSDIAPLYRNVFETFMFLARKYADFAAYLRQSHEVAASRFAEGSVDLLHLDGFCEEESLRSALAIWLPKLSERGVLVLHDTNARGGKFGIWRVWEELAAAYPTLEFPHSEGLGLACIGARAAPDVVALCRMMEKDRHVRMMVHHHFNQVGRMSSELFTRRYEMAQSDARVRGEAAQTEELSWLRQEIESLRSDNAELRGLLKGSVAHAVGG